MWSLKQSLRRAVMVAGFAVVATGLVARPGAAEEVNMATVTCADIVSQEQNAIMLFWIDGYLSHRSDDTMMDEEWIEELGGVLAQACGNGDTRPLLQIATEYVDS